MFLRETQVKGKKYLYLLQSYWKDGKSKHKLIASLGSVEPLKKSGQLQNVANALLKYCNQSPNVLDLTTLQEKNRKCWGPVHVFKTLWFQFQLWGPIHFFVDLQRVKFDWEQVILTMLLDRLVCPQSKLKSYQNQDRYHGITPQALHHFYRGLDVLAKSKAAVEAHVFEKNYASGERVDVVLYDVTTLYFESVRADAFREFGYGKDGKHNEVQILFGLLVDQQGRPLGFDLFPGNTYEGHTLAKALQKLDSLKKRFKVGRLIILADQGMLSHENLTLLKNSGYDYIVGGRIKNKSRAIKTEILSPKGYQRVSGSDEATTFQYKVVACGEDRLICSWSKARADKDQKDRERLIEKAQKMIQDNQGEIVSRRGALRYIDFSTTEGELNEKRISEDEQWDGYYGVQTNMDDIAALTVLDYYHFLWRVEESFRVYKSHLEVRPMFHWTKKRIEGHLVLCFLAFFLERTLEIELKKKNMDCSPEKIREALNAMEYSEITVEGKSFFVRSPIPEFGEKILHALKIKTPPPISAPDHTAWT